MFHYFNNLVNAANGNALPGYLVYVLDAGGTIIPIYSDESGTPIQTVSDYENAAITDAEGNYDLYVDDGTYSLQFRTVTGSILDTIVNVPMISNVALVDLSSDDGATLVGTATGDTVQQELDAKVPTATLAASAGSSLVGFLQSGTGAVTRDVLGKLRDTVSLLDFIPVNLHAAIKARTSTTNVASYVQAALDAMAAVGGGKVFAPAGKYRLLSTINVPAGVSMTGEAFGWTKITGPAWGTVFSVAHTGHAFKHTSPINNQTNACITMRDFFIFCEDANASTGAGYYDQGGSYNQFDRIFIHGFKYGMIFDQTEQTEVAGCIFYEQKHSGLWLVNGPDLNPDALLGYTNRIQVRGCEFNQQVKFGILDDGGLSHDYISNNFNGCVLYAVRIAGYTNAIIEGGESEHHGQGHILLARKTYDAARFIDAVQTVRVSGLRGTSDGVGAFVKVEDAGVGDGTVVGSLTLDANNVSGLGAAAIVGCRYITELNTRGNLFPSYDTMRDDRAFKRTTDTERRIEYSQTYTLPVVASSNQADQDFTVTGAARGDFVEASFSGPSGGLVWTYPRVEAANTVRISFLNQSGSSAGGGAAGTLYINVRKR